MPVSIDGVADTLKLIRKFDPELNKAMNKEIKGAMIPIRDVARSYVPSNGEMLSGWTKPVASSDTAKYRAFPRFDTSAIRQGIVYRQGATKGNQAGYATAYYVANISPAGGIYETAGRLSKPQRPSRSLNPHAREQFLGRINSGEAMMRGEGKKRGRLIYRAWYEDYGKAYIAVIRAIENTSKAFNQQSYTLAA
jgi:hypothetical protein